MSATPKAPPPKAPPPARPAAEAQPKRSFAVANGVTAKATKVVLYGPGGVGKTELASLLKDIGVRPLFIDLEDGSKYLDVDRIIPLPQTWDDMEAALTTPEIWAGYDAVVVDSFTRAEELASQWTVDNVKTEKGSPVKSLEGYGWGKGYSYNFDTFLKLLGWLDSHARYGRHVIAIAHECTAKVPNPLGEDWIRYEPRLQSKDNGNIRARVKEWADHLLYIGFDNYVNESGKASGSGSRTIYTAEMPNFWAKSRSLSDPIPYERGSSELWRQLLRKD